jgi:tRNA(Ile)-lysidine synthase TilS/MesJ
MGWSGGKDSTYTLWLLKERYGLRVLAFTFDNGFVSPAAFKNMRVVAENLKIDHIIVKPPFEMLRKIFVASIRSDMYPLRALERASGVCNACMSLAKGIGLRMALTRAIPLVVYGWSPGQIPLASAVLRTNRRMLEAFLETARMPLESVVGKQTAPYFPPERLLKTVESFPYLVSPLAFIEYTEEEAIRRIRQLGWESPKDTDPNSTNCLLNGFACRVHQEQMGFHPYVMELAGLVREGYMTREEALARLEEEAAPEVVAAVMAKLRLVPALRGGTYL